MLTFNSFTQEITDDDGQLVATLSDNATPEQGHALTNAYNAYPECLTEMRRLHLAICDGYIRALNKHPLSAAAVQAVRDAIAESLK
jgi:hypothetical protein